ncbi:DDHD domain-containing protein [Amylocarpus encephaloides]|uniref:DDHD domain-containing protein n=1 Tax=Amylocarpus encephaloides TaxID=45428 RepID=A0A9P7YPJ4_9HELO|nr:DDHD domain-containing protein [Amylocarpus encephaloides]
MDAPDVKSEKVEKSYLSAAVESISPWGGSRSSTPKPTGMGALGEASGLKNQHGGDHTTQHWHGLRARDYPSDCPPLNARWFYAVDSPKRKPKLLSSATEDSKPAPPPKKFALFSKHDSRAIEAVYLKITEDYHNGRDSHNQAGGDDIGKGFNQPSNTSQEGHQGVRVPVHEDFLFDVDIERRELAPVYWLGPIFQVTRGTWFYDDGKACDENLASQLEQGYLKIKPFRYPPTPPKSRPVSMKPGEEPRSLAASEAFGRDRSGSGDSTPRGSLDGNRGQLLVESVDGAKDPGSQQQVQKTYRLFGTYMNSVVHFQDSTVAWLSVDSIMSRMSSTVYQKFAGGGYLGGVRLTRGYSESRKSTKDAAAADKPPNTPVSAMAPDASLEPGLQLDERQQKLLKRRSAPPNTPRLEDPKAKAAESAATLLIDKPDPESEAELLRKHDESMMQNDYNDRDSEDQSRPIDHLILCTHGIGQRLGMRTESVNFIGDCNILRQTLKNVYGGSADLQALNSEIDKLPKNCRIQVLPVCWRHLLDFPKKRLTKREHDLGDAESHEDEYPSLEDITIEGVPFVRSLITDLALDILLYQSAYREHIMVSVLDECNRIFALFKERHPEFNGKVHLMGHSLGSAIVHDLLCRQKETRPGSTPHQRRDKHHSSSATKAHGPHLEFDFDVDDFYCLGSPIGLFQMLKGRTISARHSLEAPPAESPLDPDYMQDPFLAAGPSAGFSNGDHLSQVTGLPLTVSSPKVGQLYNIFHPSDPIAYRLEPLIAPSMASMKPQLLPYTRNTLSASVSGIGAKVGQSFSGLWSSLSSGIASSLLNRSLGLTNDDVARMEAGPSSQTKSTSQSVAAGTNISAGGVVPTPTMPSLQRENTIEKKKQLAEETAAADRDGSGGSAPTLIDDDIETLYSNFQKSAKTRHSAMGSEKEWNEAEEKGRKFKRDEGKVRSLNRNGRVDYSIQESVLDFNPINTIASHLSYWADEDVSHFIMSQLLSRNRPAVRDEKPLRKK